MHVITVTLIRNPVLLATVSSQFRDSKALVRDYFASFLLKKPVGTITESTTEIDCITATRVGMWTVALTDPNTGTVTNVSARFSFVYVFEDNDWKINHLHSSVLPAGTF